MYPVIVGFIALVNLGVLLFTFSCKGDSKLPGVLTALRVMLATVSVGLCVHLLLTLIG